MSDVLAKAELDKLYAELPKIDCQKKCHSSCGPIEMSRVEWQRIIKKKGYEPKATTLTCPLLVANQCSVYTIRPMICRLWGLVVDMQCPWGCKPERLLSRVEAYEFLLRADMASDPEHAGEIEEMLDRLHRNAALVEAMGGVLHVKPQVE